MNGDLPFEIDQKYDLFKILEHPHEIPYHSRPFMWTREEYVEHVVRQSIRKFNDGAPHWLGFAIIYSNKAAMPSASDAQHRFTVYYLMWMACAELLDNTQLLAKISRYGSDGDLLEETVSSEDAQVLERYEWRRMPNIQSVYQQDLEALGNLLNGRRVAKKSDEYKSSRLYEAYDAVLDILREALPDAPTRQRFLQFIWRNTKVSRMIISDWNFALEVFDVINNIKVKVPPIFLLKNALVRRLGEAASVVVHERFHAWERQLGSGASFDQFMHLMASLFCRQWCTLDNYPRYVLERIEQLDTIDPLAAFTAVVERGIAVRDWMSKNPYAQILQRFAGGHEVIDHCLFPVLFHASDRLDTMEPFVRALIAYGLRWHGRFSFNPSSYRSALLSGDAPIAKLLEGRETVDGTLYGIRKLLHAWLATSPMPFQDRIAAETFKATSQFTKARAALLYIAERTDKHEAVLDHSLVDIDHISPKQPRKGDPVLANPENTHRLGNFTPFMGKNSASGLKGNRSLGNQPYTAKREMYAQSNIKMTRDLAAMYPTEFTDAEIEVRSRVLAATVDKLTREDLGGL